MDKIRRVLTITIVLFLFFGLSIFVTLPVGCTLNGETINPLPTRSSSELIEKLDIDDLAAQADLVLLGEVVDVAAGIKDSGKIYTSVIFFIEKTYKGDSINVVIIDIPGGIVNGQIQVVEDIPNFQLGERAVVFLKESNEIFQIIGGFQGKFTIDSNNRIGNVPFNEFVEQVRNAIAKSSLGGN